MALRGSFRRLSPKPPAKPQSTVKRLHTATATPRKLSAYVGGGTVNGQRWSVTLEFDPGSAVVHGVSSIF